MKTLLKDVLAVTVLSLSIALTLLVGCATPKSDPLKGWTFHPFPGFETPPYGHNSNHINQAIADDYHNFIVQNKLVLFGAAITGYYENAAGQHAVEFEAFPPNQNATWHYVLIYDEQNNRIKTIKYGYTKYQS